MNDGGSGSGNLVKVRELLQRFGDLSRCERDLDVNGGGSGSGK